MNYFYDTTEALIFWIMVIGLLISAARITIRKNENYIGGIKKAKKYKYTITITKEDSKEKQDKDY